MYSFFETLKNIWKITELRDRIFITLFFLAIYRLGAQVVLPGIKLLKFIFFILLKKLSVLPY